MTLYSDLEQYKRVCEARYAPTVPAVPSDDIFHSEPEESAVIYDFTGCTLIVEMKEDGEKVAEFAVSPNDKGKVKGRIIRSRDDFPFALPIVNMPKRCKV